MNAIREHVNRFKTGTAGLTQETAFTVEQKRWAESDRCVWATDYHRERERERMVI